MASLSRAWSARTEVRCALTEDWLEHSLGSSELEEGAQLASAAAEPMFDLQGDLQAAPCTGDAQVRSLPRLSPDEVQELARRLGLPPERQDQHSFVAPDADACSGAGDALHTDTNELHIATPDVEGDPGVPRRFRLDSDAWDDFDPPRSRRNHALRALLERWQQKEIVRPQRSRFDTDWSAFDAALGGGLPRAAVHEILAGSPAAPLRTFAFRLALRCRQSSGSSAGGHLLYLTPRADLYPPALLRLGIPLSRLLLAQVADPQQAQWVCEQALRNRGIAAVVAELPGLDATRSRRLQLAAEEHGTLGLLLRSDRPREGTFAFTRMRLDCLPGQQVQVALLKVREAQPPPPFRISLPLDAIGYQRGAGPLMRSRTA